MVIIMNYMLNRLEETEDKITSVEDVIDDLQAEIEELQAYTAQIMADEEGDLEFDFDDDGETDQEHAKEGTDFVDYHSVLEEFFPTVLVAIDNWHFSNLMLHAETEKFT
jgi:FtsZ-binding cell division protein ZapB